MAAELPLLWCPSLRKQLLDRLHDTATLNFLVQPTTGTPIYQEILTDVKKIRGKTYFSVPVMRPEFNNIPLLL